MTWLISYCIYQDLCLEGEQKAEQKDRKSVQFGKERSTSPVKTKDRMDLGKVATIVRDYSTIKTNTHFALGQHDSSRLEGKVSHHILRIQGITLQIPLKGECPKG